MLAERQPGGVSPRSFHDSSMKHYAQISFHR